MRDSNNHMNKSNSQNRLDNYNHKYISLKNNNFLKNDVNYVQKNKEFIKEQEKEIKEIKLKKENDALNLLLSYKTRNTEGVRARVYDYEIQQKEKRKKLMKNSKFKIRNFSSERPKRKEIIINYENRNQNIGSINQDESKKNKNFTKSVKLPLIKPSTSPVLEEVPILHKDYGKMPEYLEKRKKELKDQKELEERREKEKRIPMGWKILTEEERQTRLESLKTEKRDLEEKLYKLPIARLSNQQKEVKANIEKSLYDIDEKINKLVGYKEVMVRKEEEDY